MSEPEEKKTYEPIQTGRYNVFSYRAGLWNLVFVPFGSPVMTIIMRNLSRDDAMATMDIFNGAMKDLLTDISEDE